MKRIKQIIFLVITITMGLHAQTATPPSFLIHWDQTPKSFKNGLITDFEIIKADSNNVNYSIKAAKMALFGYNGSAYLVKQDRQKNEYNFLDIMSETDNKLTFLSTDTINNQFHKFSYFYNKKDKKVYLFDETYDYINLAKKESAKKIAEIDMSNKGSEVDNAFILHENGRILFRYACSSRKKHYYGLEVFNKNLEREWGTYGMALTEDGYNVESNYKIDQEGNVYAIQRNFEDKSDVNTHYERSRVWVVCYPKNGAEPISQLLLLKDNCFISAMQLSLNNNYDVICAGLYSMPNTKSAVGAFSFVIEPMLTKIKNINYKQFSPELITKGYDAKKAEKNIKSIVKKKDFDEKFGYNVNDIHYRNDGGFDLVAEKYYKVTEIVTSNGSTTYTYYHYFDDLWVLNYNADGTFKWVQKIPKYEYVINNCEFIGGYFLSYEQDDSFNFIFNLANCSKTLFSLKTNSKTINIKLDKNGNERFTELISDNEIASTFAPKYCKKIAENEFLLTRVNFTKRLPLGTLTIGKCENSFTFGTLKFK